MIKMTKKVIMDEKTKSRCNYIIHTSSAAAGGIGASPVPGSDAMPLMAIQVGMIMLLAQELKIPLEEATAKAIAKNAIAKNIGKLFVGELTKAIPGFGSAVNAGVAFCVTEVLGWDFVNEYITECAFN